MERTEILAAMGDLKLFGMRAAYDEIVARAIKRQHEPPRTITLRSSPPASASHRGKSSKLPASIGASAAASMPG